ncbi:MAG: cytochrome c [Hyphomicrobiaceae bacterium]|nr:cytochrome c [Hyphomicrobiaceae bacterium]
MTRLAKRIGIFLVAVSLSTVLPYPTAHGQERSQDKALQDELAEAGRAIVKDKCARCHAIGMDDTSPHEQAPPFRDVVTRYPSENLAEALAEGIVSGHPDMPVFVFQPEEIEGFIAYLDSLSPPTDK